MSRYRKRRRDEAGRVLFYSATPAAEARRGLPDDVLQLAEELSCRLCKVPVLVVARQYHATLALAAECGVGVLACCACLELACEHWERPVGVVELEDQDVARRLAEFEGQRN
jgi:hypothetical protein